MTRIETLSIVHQPPRILLGLKNKKKKFGGKFNGWGGGVKPGETIEEAVRRENFGEGGITIKNPIKLGIILFKFMTDEHDHEVHIYRTEGYEGTLKASNDFVGYSWFHENHLPIKNMMPADRYWLPFFVKDKMFKGNVCFDDKFNVLYHKIIEVERLD